MGKIRNEEMFFREEVTGHHHGQTDITLTALLKNESAVGYVQYAVYENIPSKKFHYLYFRE